MTVFFPLKLCLVLVHGEWKVISSPFLLCCRRFRDKQDRLNMMDAVAALLSDDSLSLLTDLILLSPRPNKELVERLLITSAGFEHIISEVIQV